MALTGQRTFSDYVEAERFADQWAGGTQEYAAVVEDFDQAGQFTVMDIAEAQAYVRSHDAEIQYDADHRPICPLCLQRNCDEHEPV
jgi:hypothetical protein